MKEKYIFVLLFWCLASVLVSGQSTKTLDLATALERGRSNASLEEVMNGRLALAEGRIAREREWDNPNLMVSSEDLDQNGFSARETYLVVSQRFELFGTRKARTRAAEHRRNAVVSENEVRLLEMDALIRDEFHQLLYVQKRLDILDSWLKETADVVEIIAVREQAGEVSGYDRRRLTKELSRARAMVARDQAIRAERQVRLNALLNLEGDYVLTGSLLPVLPKQPAMEQHPTMRAFDQELEAVALEEEVAGHWILPEITLSAGFKSVDIAGERENGLFLSADLPLPLFDRNRSDRMQARARARMVRGERELAMIRLRSRAVALDTRIRHLMQGLEQYRVEVLETSLGLAAIARLAYREGEMDILSLLDAHQSLRDDHLDALSMEVEIRDLANQLIRLGGVQ